MRVVLHGGFHKTATSFLQSVLQRNRGYLARNGVMYLHHRDVRKNFTVPCQLNAYEKIGVNRRTRIPDAELAAMTEDFFKPVFEAAPETLIISDENMAGHCGHCVQRGMLYHFRRAFMGGFSGALPFKVDEVYLSVRHYGDFFAAAYGEYLRSATTHRFVTEEDMKTRLLDRMPSWHLTMTSVASAFPDSEIRVWRYEDFSALSTRVLQQMVGPSADVERFKVPQSRNVRPSPSHKAISMFVQTYKTKSPEEALARRQEFELAYPKNDENPGYNPWTAAEYDRLSAAYEEHWAKIVNNPRFTVISP